jgi:type I restriction enzyme S subunit
MIEEDRMSQSWPVVALGEVIEHLKEFIEIQDAEQYKRCRVQLHAKGIVLRDIVTGADIRTKRQQVCRTGEFLVAEIDAKLGGFGIVPEELEDAIVSSHYFLFTVNETKLERSFLDYYIRTATFQDQVTAQGSTNYAAIRPQHVLEYTIPLPPLDEQRRIVARIEALAGRVAEAQRLRAEALAQVERMVASESYRLFARLFTEDEVTTIGQVVTFHGDLLRPTDGKTGLQRFVGLQHVESHTGEKIGEDWVLAEDLQGRKFRFSAGEIVYGYLRPYLNKVWIADGEGLCSVDQYILRPAPKLIDTHYLAYFMRSPHFLQRANELTHNLMLPRLRSGLLASIEIPVPILAKQQKVVLLLDKLHAKGQRPNAQKVTIRHPNRTGCTAASHAR